METDKFFKTAFSIDLLVVRAIAGKLEVLLMYRTEEPSPHCWALPGKLVAPTEAINSEMEEWTEFITGLNPLQREPIGTFGNVERHPDGRVLTIAEYALLPPDQVLTPFDEAPQIQWFDLAKVPSLPFDHNEILSKMAERLQQDFIRQPLVFRLLPEKFTLAEIQRVYEAVYQRKMDKRNFARQIKGSELVQPLEEKRKPEKGPGRYARLYTQRKDITPIRNRAQSGFNF